MIYVLLLRRLTAAGEEQEEGEGEEEEDGVQKEGGEAEARPLLEAGEVQRAPISASTGLPR